MVRTRRKTEASVEEAAPSSSSNKSETDLIESTETPIRRSGRPRKPTFLESPSELLGVKARRGSRGQSKSETDNLEHPLDSFVNESVSEPPRPELEENPVNEPQIFIRQVAKRGRPRKKPVEDKNELFDSLKQETPSASHQEVNDELSISTETESKIVVNKNVEQVRESDNDSTPSPRRRSRRFNLANLAKIPSAEIVEIAIPDEVEPQAGEDFIEIVVEESVGEVSANSADVNAEIKVIEEAVRPPHPSSSDDLNSAEKKEEQMVIIDDGEILSDSEISTDNEMLPRLPDSTYPVKEEHIEPIKMEDFTEEIVLPKETLEEENEEEMGEEENDNTEIGQLEVCVSQMKFEEAPNLKVESQENSQEENEESKSVEVSQDEGSLEEMEVEETQEIRRSRRIKKIKVKNQRSVGRGLVKDSESKFMPKPSDEDTFVEEKYETPKITLEMIPEELIHDKEAEERLKKFIDIKENEYKCGKNIGKESKKMLCDCFLTQEEVDKGNFGCGEDCLNRLLLIECGPKCNVGSRCTNKRFQNASYASCKIFHTEKKGFGILAMSPISPGEFIMEYVGEVLNSNQFEKRVADYSKRESKHYYFMALRSDAIIDATTRGNMSRFMNHSCDPNAETQKWTVNGEVRIGFFSKKAIMPGEEITFDYQFQLYGKEAQKCYCEATNCRGWIGTARDEDSGEESGSELYESGEEEEEEEEEECIETTSTTVKEVKKRGRKKKDPTFKIKLEKPKRAYRRSKQRQEILDDMDLDDEINVLSRTGLKNQQHTLKLSRLMVRAELMDARIRLLKLLKEGELPCRRLFLDYHGLRLLHGWMEGYRNAGNSSDDDVLKRLKFQKIILELLEVLPISNKTMLKDSKVLFVVEKWAHDSNPNPQTDDPMPEQPKSLDTHTNDSSSASGDVVGSNAGSEPSSFNPEMFAKIPDIISIEKLKQIIDTAKASNAGEESSTEKVETEIQNEVNPDDGSKIEDTETSESEKKELVENKRTEDLIIANIEVKEEKDRELEIILRHKENSKEDAVQAEIEDLNNAIFQLANHLLSVWEILKEVFRIPKKERIEQMKEHEREADLRYQSLKLTNEDDNRHVSRYRDKERSEKRAPERVPEVISHPYNSHNRIVIKPQLSKQQRRHMFEMQVAKEEASKREQEIRYCHEQNCMKFGLIPHLTNPNDIPAMMNPITGQYYSFDRRPLPTPPSHQYMKIIPPPLSTNPADYELPPMDLPPLWKFAIDERGRLYYYHVKIRIPQWHPPIKIQPLNNSAGQMVDEESAGKEDSDDSSTTDTEDSEEEDLEQKLEILKKCRERTSSKFNLDDVLAKPGDIDDDAETSVAFDETQALLAQANAKIWTDMLNTSTNFTKTLDSIMPNLKRIKRRKSGLVQERPISPRTQQDKILGKIKMQQYRETKEKLRRRKREVRKRQQIAEQKTSAAQESTDEKPKIVDELDIIHSDEAKKPSVYEEWKKQEEKISLERKRSAETRLASEQIKKKKLDARKIKDKFIYEISIIIKQQLSAYTSDQCKVGRITNEEDFKHLTGKLPHFVMLKELKHCNNAIQELQANESVKGKAREFVKKYMAKYGAVYFRPDNDRECNRE